MQVYDDRLLERLEEEGWSTTRSLATAVGMPVGLTRDRLLLLADAGLVAFATNDYDLVHLTTSGALYLEGERDQAEHPHPIDVGRATGALRG
jgi:hypothetical protein